MKSLFILLLLLLSLNTTSVYATTENTESTSPLPLKILFIGNSYTYGFEDLIQLILSNSKNKNSTLSFQTRGATALEYFANDKETKKIIRNGKWDYVVLQEWSTGVGSSAKNTESFQKSTKKLVKLIRKSGAEPILFMTWGRENSGSYQDYTDMIQRVSQGYIKAGKQNNIKVAPIGLIWDDILKNPLFLGKLYSEDKSHAAVKGNILIISTFFNLFFNSSLEWLPKESGLLSESEMEIITQSITTRINETELFKLNLKDKPVKTNPFKKLLNKVTPILTNTPSPQTNTRDSK